MGLITHRLEYLRAGSVAEATQALAANGEDARVIAGGQSLVPLMKLQLAQPSLLVDISAIPDLDRIDVGEDSIQIGALVRHVTLERSPIVRKELPLLAEAAAVVGDPQIRTMGTLGGVIAHADPAGDYCMLAALFEATIVTTAREIVAKDFFKDTFTTALGADEMVVAVRFPRTTDAHAYVKDLRLPYNAGVPGVAVQRMGSGWRVALTNLGSVPVRATEVERRLVAGASPADAVEGAWRDFELTPNEDMPADYRREMASVMTRRALESAQS